MVVNRMEMINSYLREVISATLHKVKDPRLSPLVSVVEVDTSRDLRSSRVYVSLLADAKEKERNLTALRSAAGFIRREIGPQLSFKTLPELIFLWDDSIERGTRICQLIERLSDNDGAALDGDDAAKTRKDAPESV